MASKWNQYDEQITDLLRQEKFNNNEIARQILNVEDNVYDVTVLRTYIKRNKNRLLDLNEGIYETAESVAVDYQNVPHYWDKTNKERSVFVKNPNYVSDLSATKPLEELQKALIDDLKQYSPKYNTYIREHQNDSNLLVIDPADVHIGKLCSSFEVGESYNNQIAVNRVLNGVNGILNKVSSLNIDKILFIIGNDILHIDNPKRTTTSGTPQDTDGMWHSNFIIAKQLYVDIIEKLMCVADVEVIFNPSNHDYTNGFFLAQLIETHFRNSENVKFDCSISHRKYFVYHDNLIGTTHGDGAKQQDLPMLMANESNAWTNCKHRYFYIHHFHHKISKDYMSVCVESLRSPSGTDSWHHRNGYEHAPKAIEGFIHDKKHGQIMRITHLF